MAAGGISISEIRLITSTQKPAMINKRNPNEAQKQSDPPVSGDRQTAERCRASRDDSGGGCGEISQRSGVAGH